MNALAFFNGERNTDGRTIDEILAGSDEELEWHHDIIQWCFPLHEPSGVNPDAPVVTVEEQKVLAAHPGVKKKMREVLERWLSFYGFELKGGEVVRGEDFGEKSRRWNRHLDHNHLRITRIIRSLRLFGLEEEARAVHGAFAEFARSGESQINRTTQAYWDVALNAELFAPIRGR